MKEATGELNLTVITVIAIAAIAAIFYAFVWPALKDRMAKSTCAAECGCETNIASYDSGECECSNNDTQDACGNAD
ncbi:MAG: hypothetical protein GX663_10805 [Clostridiales bacterium]|nr:hypothetical protein [Clostridiales bacterium]